MSEFSSLYGIPGLMFGFKFSVGDKVEILTERYGRDFLHRIAEIQEISFSLCELPVCEVKVENSRGGINILYLLAHEIEFPDILDGRIVCVDKSSDDFPVTIGKIYNVVNGLVYLDGGEQLKTTTLRMLNLTLKDVARFIKIVEEADTE